MTRFALIGGAVVLAAWALTTFGCKQTSIGLPGSQPDLNGVYVAAPDAVWAVGEGGAIFFYDGVSWTQQPTTADTDLHGVHGSGPSDLWAVGDFAITHHYDGSSWERVEMPDTLTLYAVWALAADDVWATGQAGSVVHYDGTEWVDMERPGLGWSYGVWGSAADDVWIAGGASVAGWDGSTWSTASDVMFGRTPRGVHGAGGAVLAVGGNEIARFDGTSWAVETVREGASFLDVFATDDGQAWAVGYQGGGPMGNGGGVFHYDGAGWTELFSGRDYPYFRAVHGTGPSDVWAVGDRGLVMHWDGAEWLEIPLEEEATEPEA